MTFLCKKIGKLVCSMFKIMEGHFIVVLYLALSSPVSGLKIISTLSCLLKIFILLSLIDCTFYLIFHIIQLERFDSEQCLNLLSLHEVLHETKMRQLFCAMLPFSGILICTDVMARGVDIPEVNWVIQYDPPSSARYETWLLWMFFNVCHDS